MPPAAAPVAAPAKVVANQPAATSGPTPLGWRATQGRSVIRRHRRLLHRCRRPVRLLTSSRFAWYRLSCRVHGHVRWRSCSSDDLVRDQPPLCAAYHRSHIFLLSDHPWRGRFSCRHAPVAVRGGGACLVCGNLPPVSGRRIMAPEEGERISQPGKDGTIFVLDLSHIDGQHAAEALECEHEEVEIILRQTDEQLAVSAGAAT